MNENTIQDLGELLAEALVSVEIRNGRSNQLTVTQYRAILEKCRAVYSPSERRIVNSFQPKIVSTEVEQKVLGIIGRVLTDYVRDGLIQSATIAISSGIIPGSPVEDLLRNLLVLAIVNGPAEAADAFAKCARNSSCTFHRFFLINGVTVPKRIDVVEGLALIPLPNSASQLPPHLPEIIAEPRRFFPNSIDDLLGKTLARLEYEVSPVFHRPLHNISLQWEPEDHFRVRLKGGEVPDLDALFQALSLACRRSVKPVMVWTSLLDYEVFDLSSYMGLGANGFTSFHYGDTSDEPVQIKSSHEDAIKILYRGLTVADAESREKLRIPIDRWAKSTVEKEPLDQIIDLGIALESLYVPDGRSEVRYRLSHHAAWHLGRDKQHRQDLSEEFRQIYDARSDIVHTGRLRGRRVKPTFNVSEFVSRAQDLCRQGITKIINAGEIPEWKDLIMGEDLD